MTGVQVSAGLLLLFSLSTANSTCHGQSGGDVSKDPTAPPADVSLPGVDTSALTPREKKEWSTYVGELLAPCSDAPVSIAQCVLEKRKCAKCLPAAKYILKGVRDGMSQEQIEKSYHGRFDADKIRSVDVGNSPAKGPVGASVTVIEFADFECPYCAMMAPVIEQVWQQRSQEMRFVYKFMPLSGHPHGEPAARAAIAALDQGKFWEMHDKLFANRDHLEQSDIDGYAKDLGLDLNRFHADMQSQATTDRIAIDRKEADSLDVKGTPTIYVNGREFDIHQDLNEWIAQDTGEVAKPSSTAPPSVAATSTKAIAKRSDDAGSPK
jgi:protein-disulfide isomerase